MQCHAYEPAPWVWNVNVVREWAAIGTFRPRPGTVNVCETSAGASFATVVVAPAEPFGFLRSIRVTVTTSPIVPVTAANCSDPLASGVASSKFVIVTVTVEFAARVRSDGTKAGYSVLAIMSPVTIARLTWIGLVGEPAGASAGLGRPG